MTTRTALAAVLLCVAMQAVAQTQPPPDEQQSVQGAARDDRQEAASVATDREVARNTQQIADLNKLSGNQDFVLKILGLVIPMIGTIIAAVVLVFQQKQKLASESRAQDMRDNLILIARSVNGVRTELVARSELAAFLEGVKSEGKSGAPITVREAELTEALRVATEKSRSISETVEKQLLEKDAATHAGVPAPDPVVTAPMPNAGHQTLVVGDVVKVAPGEIKTVVGTGAERRRKPRA